MTYCINPACPKPKNSATANQCQACGTSLLLRDRYRAIQALGRGGFGATFLAKDEGLPGHPLCVIKQLRPSADSPHLLDMARDLFQREAKTLGKIGSHTQIPRLLDYFEINQQFFLVQEYVSGSTLQKEVKQGGPFTEAGVKQFLTEVLPLMQYVHSQGVIHRDIKPANLIRREQDKKLVLIDFGAVKDKVNPVQAEQSEQTALTAYAIGTPGYAPPEQMAMRPVYASDIYAIGITCVFLLTGKSPKDLDYDPNTGEMLWRDQVHISDHFAKVLQKMLEISVKHRYQSADAILRDMDLEPYMEGLAQNMVVKPNKGPNDPGPASSPSVNFGDPSSPSSPHARMAAMIRARKERQSTGASSTTGRTDRIGQGGMSSVTSGYTSRDAKKPARVTADDVKTFYVKGKRDFSNIELNQADLQNTRLPGVTFADAKLMRANFERADLSSANFGRANLKQACFRKAALGGCYFNYANLEGADLRGADLSHALLTNANLRGANLCGAILTGAKISDDQLDAAKTNFTTVYPSGRRGIR